MTRLLACCTVALLMACAGRRGPQTRAAPAPVSDAGASAATIDSLWKHAESAFRHGKWGDAEKVLGRAVLEFSPGDPRIPRAHFYIAESMFAQGRQLEAAREFRKTSDETPNDPLAPSRARPDLRTNGALYLSGAPQSVWWHRCCQASTAPDQ